MECRSSRAPKEGAGRGVGKLLRWGGRGGEWRAEDTTERHGRSGPPSVDKLRAQLAAVGWELGAELEAYGRRESSGGVGTLWRTEECCEVTPSTAAKVRI